MYHRHAQRLFTRRPIPTRFAWGVLAAGLVACGGTLRDPGDLSGPGTSPPGSSSQASPVFGQWRHLRVFILESDVQTTTTDWTFDRDLTCRFKRTFESLVAGVPDVTERRCRFVIEAFDLVVTFDDAAAAGPVRLPYTFAASSPDRLVLEGVEYERLA